MIRGYIKNGYSREALFSEGMEHKDVLKCTARFGLNEVDSAELTLPASNRPARSLLTKNAVIELQNDGEIVFIGEVAAVPRNELGDISFELDGALGFLSGVCKAPFTIKPSDPNGPVENFLTAIFAQYNATVPAERQLRLGAVTVTGGVEMDHKDEYTNMLDLVREVREQLGGFLYVDYTDGLPTVHYVATPTAKAARPLVLGENVLTVDDRLDFTNYASRVYATGSYYVTTGGKREKKPLNAGYVVDTDAEAVYGRKDLAFKSNTDMGGDEDAGIPDKTQQEATAIILAEAQMILDERKVPLRSLEMTATELARMGVDHRQYKVGTVAPAHVQILDIDTELVVRSVCPDYIDQGNSTVSFGRQAATISGASLGGGGSVSGGGSSGSGQVGPPGPAGPAGADGYSPVVTVEAITGGHRVTIEDRTGEHVFDVMDGDSTSAPVRSVNGKTGVVVLSASDVGAMPAGTFIPVKISDLTDDSNFISHGNGVIAKNELVSTVQASLDKADTAVLFTADQGLNDSQKGHARANIDAGKSTVTYSNGQLTISNPGEAYKVVDLSNADVFGVSIQKYIWNGETQYSASKTFTQIRDAVVDDKIIEFNFEDSTTGESYYSYEFCVKNGTNNVMELEVKFCREVTASAAHYFIATFYGNDTFALNEVTHAGGGSGSGNFVKIAYNSNTAAVTHNGAAITGAQIKALIDRQDGGAIMVDTYLSPNAVYKLKNIYSNGDVEFEGEFDGNTMNVVIAAAASSGTLTIKPGTDPLIIPITYDGTTYTTTVSAWNIYNWRDNCEIEYSGRVRMTDYGMTGPLIFLYFCRVNVESSGDANLDLFEVEANTSTGTVTVTRRRTTLKKNLGLTFRYDATRQRVVSIKTGSDVTGNDIASLMDEHGVQPMIFYNYRYYHLYSQDSSGPYFRTVDNTREIWLSWASYNADARNVT